MDSSCKVSVYCTAYNHENYIRQALDSFLAQKTDFPFEVLVTDDASTDSTPAILREYQEKHPDIIRYFHQEKNLFQQGIDVCQAVMYPNTRGKYVAFCEGDDYLTDSSKLQLQADFLDSHPDYSACVHNTWYHWCDSDRLDELLVPEQGDRDIPFETVIRGPAVSFHTSSIMVRTEILTNPPDFQDVAFRYGFSDYPMFIWFAMNGKIRFLDRPMSVYRLKSNETAWSAGCGREYGKRIEFVIGEIEMMKALLPHLSGENALVTREELLKREYVLLYLKGDVRSMLAEPYRRFFRQESLSFRMKQLLKLCAPHLHAIYRDKKGYYDE